MKKIFTIFVFVAATSFFACDQDLTGYEIPNQSDNESQDLSYAEGVSSSRLVFATKANIVAQLNQLKESKQLTLPKSATTRSVDGEEDTTFVSLRESLAAQGIVGLSTRNWLLLQPRNSNTNPKIRSFGIRICALCSMPTARCKLLIVFTVLLRTVTLSMMQMKMLRILKTS